MQQVAVTLNRHLLALLQKKMKKVHIYWGPHRNQQSVPHGESEGRSYLVD